MLTIIILSIMIVVDCRAIWILLTVTGFSMVASVLTSGVVCTIYTGLGGIKAVVWTDTLQMAIVFLGLVVLAIKGVYAESVGEPATVLNRVKDGNRFDFGVLVIYLLKPIFNSLIRNFANVSFISCC